MTQNPPTGAAIVTGASRGLGLGIARGLASAGYPVVLAARGADQLERAADGLLAQGHRALAVPTDVTSPSDVAALVAAARERFGSIDVVVNNAGAIPVLEPFQSLTWDRWRNNIDVDVRGVFNVAQAAGPVLGDGATMVNLAAAVEAGGTLHASLSPSQAALLSLSRCLGGWLHDAGVAVHCLCPRITPAGGVGLSGATRFGADAGIAPDEWFSRRFGDEAYDADDVGAGVVALVDERVSGAWRVGPRGLGAWDVFPSVVPA